jgi:2-isopropylmalate synthase
MKKQQTSESAKEMEKMLAVSPYNQLALSGVGPIKDIKIFDTTLRDGEQAPGIALSPEDKIRIALALDDLGVDYIEAGFAASGQTEKETITKLSGMKLDARICSLARTVKSDIDAVIDAGVDLVHTFIATSDLHMKYKLKMTPEEVRAKAIETVEYAKAHGLEVQFSCEDSTRSNLDFMKAILLDVQNAGASSVNIPDTVGVIIPRAMERLIGELHKTLSIPISVHCHNDMGLAVANTIAAVDAGATICHVCMNGIGERAGNASLEEVALNLFANYRVQTVDLSKIGSASKVVERVTGFALAGNKPIVGRNAFAHESGIHVHGIMNNTSTYEPFLPELIGVDRHIVIGKHSGVHSVRGRLDSLGIRFPNDHMNELMETIKNIAIGGKMIDDAELLAIVDNILWKKETLEKTVSLDELTVLTGKNTTSTATVSVTMGDGERRTAAETGVGPVDAAINAIRKSINEKITMEEYKLSAITGKSDSICEVTVMLKNVQNDGSLTVGKAVGLDIVETSVDATMAAINRDFARRRRE